MMVTESPVFLCKVTVRISSKEKFEMGTQNEGEHIQNELLLVSWLNLLLYFLLFPPATFLSRDCHRFHSGNP